MIKKIKKVLLVLPLLVGLSMVITSCGGSSTNEDFSSLPSDSNHNESSTTSIYTGDYKINLTAIGSTTIKASKTVQIRSQVTGTIQKDVTWSSSNDTIATVSSSGLVSGVSAGEVKIRATLNIEPACYAEIKVTVEAIVNPTKITIENVGETTQWSGETRDLTITAEPVDASSQVTWATNNEAVATISQTGHVEFLKAGDVTITATSVVDSTIFSSINYNVKDAFFRSDLGSPYWNLEHQSDTMNPFATLEIDASKTGYHSLYCSHILSQKYYVEATFHIKEMVSTWVWQGIGIGSGLSEADTRYYMFSPAVEGQGNAYNKTIVKDLPNESWPAITTRSQVWGENGLNDINWHDNDIKMGMLRNGTEHYWLINDRVMWYDNSDKYADVDTMPIIVSVDMPVTISKYSTITSSEEIDTLLQKDEFKKSFFASDPTKVEYNSDSDFTFNSTSILNKDNKVRALGDKAKLVGNFTVELDIDEMLINNAHIESFAGMTVNFSRYDAADSCESFMVGKSALQSENTNIISRFASWNYQMSMENPASIYSYLETSAGSFKDQNTHHLKITRTIENNKSYLSMSVDGVTCDFDVKSGTNASLSLRYVGAYIIWIGGEYTGGHVSNVVFESVSI